MTTRKRVTPVTFNLVQELGSETFARNAGHFLHSLGFTVNGVEPEGAGPAQWFLVVPDECKDAAAQAIQSLREFGNNRLVAAMDALEATGRKEAQEQ